MAPNTLTGAEARTAVADDLLGALAGRRGRLIAGVTGPPGVGKSTFAVNLVAELNARTDAVAAYLPMDGFHLANVQLQRLDRRGRKGAPDTFDVGGYTCALARIARESGDVYIPDFDRSVDEPVAAARVVPAAARVVVTEGNYLGLAADGWAGVRPLLDRLYYLDADSEVRRRRLVARHVSGGRTEAQAQEWADTVDGANARLIASTRGSCDRVLLIVDEPA